MSKYPAPRAPLGFGGAVGLGAAAVLLITVIAVGHAVLGQFEGAVRVVITFAEITLCVLLGAVAVGILGALVFGGQLARLHLAERRAALPPAAPPVMRAEVLADAERASVPSVQRPAIQGQSGWTVPSGNVIRAPFGKSPRGGGEGA